MTDTPPGVGPIDTSLVVVDTPNVVSSTVFLALRRLRTPLIVLILMYSTATLGLMVVPGVDAEGNRTEPLSFFHAFYFVSYTATTIGFGELPVPFSDAQRAWATVSIYLLVIGWSYAILVILGLVQDKAFQGAVSVNRFQRRVRRITEPFYLICGAGATGALVTRNLTRQNRQCVVIDLDDQRIQDLDLEDLPTDPPVLAADARVTQNLLMAGLLHPLCHGVMALTDDDEANLLIAIAARLLNAEYPILARATDPDIAQRLASFGTDHILNPFDQFAGELARSIAAPASYRLGELATAIPGAELPESYRPPRGAWIVCGFGRFGRVVTRELSLLGQPVTVLDARAHDLPGVRTIRAKTIRKPDLVAAGIEQAAGIVAATDSDAENLSIALAATRLQPRIFVVTRQNRAMDTPLFQAFHSDFSMVPTRMVAEEALAIVTTPLLTRFVRDVRQREEPWCEEVIQRLVEVGHQRIPLFWGVTLTPELAPAVAHELAAGRPMALSDLLRDPTDRDETLEVVPLLLVRDEQDELMPSLEAELQPGDRMLFAGNALCKRRMMLTVSNANVLRYVLTGREHPGGWLWQKLNEPPKASPDDTGVWRLLD
ncbi:MAG: NAD-binding protein [Kineosporiaceae bacterium]|nr:NAD-binding protein [Kineosporiaceae bacterium]